MPSGFEPAKALSWCATLSQVCTVLTYKHVFTQGPATAGVASWEQQFLMPELGAGGGTRTRGLDLGKVALYQLSYTRMKQNPDRTSHHVREHRSEVKWSRQPGSNRRLAAYEAAALPTELCRHENGRPSGVCQLARACRPVVRRLGHKTWKVERDTGIEPA